MIASTVCDKIQLRVTVDTDSTAEPSLQVHKAVEKASDAIFGVAPACNVDEDKVKKFASVIVEDFSKIDKNLPKDIVNPNTLNPLCFTAKMALFTVPKGNEVHAAVVEAAKEYLSEKGSALKVARK
jgi:hypothetical protein